MDISNLLTTEMLKALTDGDWPRLLTSTATFVFIWIEVRGLKKEFKTLNSNIANSFAAGESRMTHIEERITALEQHQQTPFKGAEHATSL